MSSESEIFDVLVVGSGPAGVWAAERAAAALPGARIGLVDVGEQPPAPRLDGALYPLREEREDLGDALLGERFESLQNLFGPPLNPKLKAPGLRYVTRRADALTPVVGDGFEAVISLACGGLANAWGGGVFRYRDEDLAGFPVTATQLEPHYDRLEAALGVSGRDDDLTPVFGPAAGLDPPPEPDEQAALFLRRYAGRRRALQAQGLRAGCARLAVSTRDREGRPGYRYDGSDFFEPQRPAVYTPAETLAALRREGALQYLPRRLALRFEERRERVVLHVRDLADGAERELAARRLLLAAGALNSARLVLNSRADARSRLPILDNPVSFVPLLAPERIGRAQQQRLYGGGLVMVDYRGAAAPEPVLGTFYGISGLLRSELAFDLPLSAAGLADATRVLAPAIAVLQLFYSDAPDPANHLGLGAGGALEIRHRNAPPRGRVERVLLRLLPRLGYFGLPALCRYAPPGASVHYAGTLPMRAEPRSPYETHVDGRLAGTRAVHVCDAATFPRLPAKNLTLTAMANSMRIAEAAAADLAGRAA